MRESILTIPISEILEPMQDCAARGKKFNSVGRFWEIKL